MTDGKREVIQGNWVVIVLVEPYFDSWRGVTVDKFFTSVALAEEIFKKGITVTGTMHSNK
jgi:hypothetical protein